VKSVNFLRGQKRKSSWGTAVKGVRRGVERKGGDIFFGGPDSRCKGNGGGKIRKSDSRVDRYPFWEVGGPGQSGGSVKGRRALRRKK